MTMGARRVAPGKLLVVAGLMLTSLGAAQARAEEPAPGTLVRVTAPGTLPRPLVGTLADWDEVQLRLIVKDGRVVSVPRSAVVRLETSAGLQGHAKQGAILGAAAGIAVGLVFLATNPRAKCERGADDPCLTFAGIVPGALLGLAVGSLVRSHDWRDASNSPRADVGFRPAGRGRPPEVALMLSW